MKTWPYLDAEEQLEAETGTASNYEGITDTGDLLHQIKDVVLLTGRSAVDRNSRHKGDLRRWLEIDKEKSRAVF